MKELLERLGSDVPRFFRWVQGFCVACALTGAELRSNDVQPEIAAHMITIGIFGTFIAQLPKKDQPKS